MFQRTWFRFFLPTHACHICLCIFVVVFLAFTTVACFQRTCHPPVALFLAQRVKVRDPMAPARFTEELVTGLSLVFFLNGIILDEDLKLSAGCQVYSPPFPCALFSSPPAFIACVLSVCKIIHRALGHFQPSLQRAGHMACVFTVLNTGGSSGGRSFWERSLVFHQV